MASSGWDLPAVIPTTLFLFFVFIVAGRIAGYLSPLRGAIDLVYFSDTSY
jgi:hypothetical protein